MKKNKILTGIVKAFFLISAILILCYGFYLIRSIFIYIIISGILALIGRPLVHFLRRKLKFPNNLAVISTMVLILSVFFGVFLLFVPVLSDQGDKFASFNFEGLQAETSRIIKESAEYFGASSEVVEEIIEDAQVSENVIDNIDVKQLPTLFQTLLSVLGNIGIGLFSTIFITFFFLKDASLIRRGITMLVPESAKAKVVNSLRDIRSLLSRYFIGMLIQLSIIFVLYSITLLIVGVENAIIIAFICALFNIIPYVGPMIGAVIMVLLTIIGFSGQDFGEFIIPSVGYVLLGVGISQLVDNFISQPLIFSNSVKSHPLEIFIIISIGGLTFGILGMVVAVPLYTCIKVFAKAFWKDVPIVKALTSEL